MGWTGGGDGRNIKEREADVEGKGEARVERVFMQDLHAKQAALGR